jgi:hypothetical protein
MNNSHEAVTIPPDFENHIFPYNVRVFEYLTDFHKVPPPRKLHNLAPRCQFFRGVWRSLSGLVQVLLGNDVHGYPSTLRSSRIQALSRYFAKRKASIKTLHFEKSEFYPGSLKESTKKNVA